MAKKTDDGESLRLIESGKAPARCHTIRLTGSKVSALPSGLEVDFKLDATGCTELESLPQNLRVPVLVLRGCTALRSLPEGLQCDYLDLQDCTALEKWPDSVAVTIGTVNARNCRSLRELPRKLGPVTSLNLDGCERLSSVPEGVQIRSWIDLGGTAIRSLPESLSRISLRWRGVAVNAQIAFFPETLRVADVLNEKNSELRRVMMERIGFERLLSEANATVLDRDQDAGGPRELLHVKLEGDEDLVCVSVRCPSTARHYLIRVPPTMKTCHQAVAWTAGFDNPDDYKPTAET
jgi:hypothetical protein